MKIVYPYQVDVIVRALAQGKVVAIPTETSYALAVDATQPRAVKRIYTIKGRDFNKPIHVLVSSKAQAKKLVVWGSIADKLTKQFWPGPLSIVSKLKVNPSAGGGKLQVLTSGTGFLGVRQSPNPLIFQVVKKLGRPITATSANVSNMPDCYSAEEVFAQYAEKQYKPDILIEGRKQRRVKPSTVIKIDGPTVTVLRPGPISEKQIKKTLNT